MTRTWHLPSVCSECQLVDTSKHATPATSSVMCRRTTGALPGPMTIRIPFKTLVHGLQRHAGHDPMRCRHLRLFILGLHAMRFHHIHVATQPPADTGFSRWAVVPLRALQSTVEGTHPEAIEHGVSRRLTQPARLFVSDRFRTQSLDRSLRKCDNNLLSHL